VLNLGVGGAGPAHFNNPTYLDLINRAEAVIVQVMSGRSASNSQFDNSRSGTLAGKRLADGKEIRADEFFKGIAVSKDLAAFARLATETRIDYIAASRSLLRNIVPTRILFWFSVRTPDYQDVYSDLPFSVFNSYPQLVNRSVLEAIRPFADEYVECVSRAGLPQQLPGTLLNQVQDGETQRLQNRYYPSPEMHDLAAELLELPCRRASGKCVLSSKSKKDEIRFLLLGAARSGTNLLLGLLNSHPACFGGGEVFNSEHVKANTVPWKLKLDLPEARLAELRMSDPVAFLDLLFRCGFMHEFTRVGFKLLYNQSYSQGEDFPAVLSYLAREKSVRVIHLKRRNLAARLVSERQALQTGIWAHSVGSQHIAPPPVQITPRDLVESISRITARQSEYDRLFAGHHVLEIRYEDLAARPLATAKRAMQFLGLPTTDRDPEAPFVKAGSNLREAIANYDDLKAHLSRWLSFLGE
jgi:LPS sulfotransferase NodH